VSDTLKDAAIVLFGLFVFSGVVNHRVNRATEIDLRRTMKGGEVHASIRPDGIFGLLIGESSSTLIRARGFHSSNLPFYIQRGAGLRANVKRLDLDFQDFTLRDSPVKRFVASLPKVSIDIGSAFFRERIVIRTAGEGTAVATVDSVGMQRFIQKKYPDFKNVQVILIPGFVSVTADTPILGTLSRVEMRGKLSHREGRFLDIIEPTILLNGKETSPVFAQTRARAINPVLDVDRDLGLAGFLYINEVEIGEGIITIRGKASVPAHPQKRASEK
jgi:hypothetical protein